MATINQLIETILDTIEGTKRGDLELRARMLREAGYLPTGKRGGGRGLAHVNSEHCANLIIGLLASSSARGVVPLVKRFRDLPLLVTESVDVVGWTPGENRPEPTTLLLAIQNMIDNWRAGVRPWHERLELAEMIGYCDSPEGPAILDFKASNVVAERGGDWVPGQIDWAEQDDEGRLFGCSLIYGARPDFPRGPHWAPLLSLSGEVIKHMAKLLGPIEDADG